MELKIRKQPIFISEMLIDTTVEQPVECDALLPDYCPDIVRILKCMITPTISSRRVTGQRLELEGMAVIVVYYTSTAEGIHKAEYKVPFARTMELRADCPKHSVSVQARPGYVSCRAVNSRRLDIRGAVTMSTFAVGSHEEQVVCGGEGAGLQLREETVTGSRLLGQDSREVRIGETLELSYGKPPIRDILRSCATPRTIECRTAEGKAVIKGELGIHMLYQHAGGCDQMDWTLPTAVVIEMDGADDQCTTSVTQELLYCNVEPTADRDGEYRAVMVEACVLVSVKVECCYKATTCTDCYSTRYQCSFRTKPHSTLALENSCHEPVTLRESMPLPDNIESVVDLWCDAGGVNFRHEQGNLIADGRIIVSMLGKMRDGDIYYFDKNIELSQRMCPCAPGPLVDGRMSVIGSGYSFTANDAIEVRCEMMLDCSVYQSQKIATVDEIAVDDKKPRTDTAPSGLYLYLTGESESVWDIAKRYNTSVQRIMEENPGSESKCADVLIIPVV